MTKTIDPRSQLAPYESGCELTNCKGCPACWRSPRAILQDAARGVAPKTRQGVANLDVMLGASGARKHEHQYVPTTYVNRSNALSTVMKCYCGELGESQLGETFDAEEDDAWQYPDDHHRIAKLERDAC